MRALASVLLYRTLGQSLPECADAAAVLWPAAHECARRSPAGVKAAGFGEGLEAGERLFDAILASPHGLVITEDSYDVSWERMGRERINLNLPELLSAVADLENRPALVPDAEWPFILSAGERRAFTANTIMRDPTWRRRDGAGHLLMSHADANTLAVQGGDLVRITTKRGSAVVPVEPTDSMQAGHVSLPNGFGVTDAHADPRAASVGVSPNELTAVEDHDEWAGTPWHKHVPARVERANAAPSVPAPPVAHLGAPRVSQITP